MRFRLLVIPIAAAMMVIGIAQLRNAPVDVLPEFAAPRVEVQTEALGLSATEVEQLITVPLEQDFLAGLPWLDDIASESVPGLSSIEMVFKPGTDVLHARQMVQERLSQAFVLPNVSTPPFMIQPLSATNRVEMVGLTSKTLSQTEMSVLSRWIIKPRLMGVPGVANVAVWGHRERQLQVQVDPNRLKQNGVTLNQVITTTGNALWVSPLTFVEASTPGTGGFVETPSQRLGIQHISPITKAADLAQVTIQDQAGGKRLRLGDVARVVEDHQLLIGDALVDNTPGLMIVVEKFPGANTLEVTRGVKQALDSLRPGLTGVDINTEIYQPATFIDRALHNLAVALILGGLLLLLVFAAFFLDWRVTLISLVAVLLSLTVAALAVRFAGSSMNSMVLAGLVLAVVFVIADAVGDAHNIARRLREHRQSGDAGSASAVMLKASLEVRGPMVYATLISLLAMVPILLLPDLTGLFFRPLALAFIAGVVASMVVSLTVTPALARLLLRNAPVQGRESAPMRWLQRRYTEALPRMLRQSKLAYGVAALIVLAGLGVVLFKPMGQSLIPTLQDRSLLVRWTAAAGTSGPEMIRISEKAGRELRSIPGVVDVGAHVGRAVTSDQVVDANSAELWITIDPAANYQRTRAAVTSVVSGYPGIKTDVQTYPEQRISQVLDVAGDDVVVRVYGKDLTVLRDKANEVRQQLSTVKGLVNPHVDLPSVEPTVQVKVDLAKAQKYGVKPGDVRRAAAALLSGVQAGSLFEEQKVFEVVVWGAPETRNSLTAIRDLLIDTPNGGQVRLGDVADVQVAATPDVIKHESVSRYIDVGATVRGRDFGAIVKEVDDKVAGMAFPVEYHAEVIGSFEDRQDNWQHMLILGAAALIGVLLLLQAAVSSWRLASVLLLTVAVAVAGGLLAGLAAGLTALTSLVAFVAVIGIAARLCIQLVGRLRHLEEREGETFGPDLVLRGAGEELAPILVTTLGTIVALLPLMFFGGPGEEVVRPMVAVMLGGLIVSTLVALFIVPALYLRFGRGPGYADVVASAQPGVIQP